MFLRFGLISAIFAVSTVSIAAAQPADLGACKTPEVDYDPGSIVLACTKLIESVHNPDRSMTEAIVIRGNAYYDGGRTDQAIADFNLAIKLSPGYAEAFLGLGNACQQKPDYNCALQAYGQAIKFKPDSYEAYNNRGTVYFKVGDMNRAIQDLDKAIELKPTLAVSVANRGRAQFIMGNCPAAMQDFETAKKLNPQLEIPENIAKFCDMLTGSSSLKAEITP